MKTLTDPHQNRIDYIGSSLENGLLPAFFYFALSGEESLSLHPYNSPTTFLSDLPLRIFSFTIPGHGAGFNKFHAMEYWAEQMTQGVSLLEIFFDEVLFGIQWLIEMGIVNAEKMATGGLSRGGFVAAHIAARDKRIKTLLGFSPLIDLEKLKEFDQTKSNPQLKERADHLNLMNSVKELTHLNHLLFYIGNRDTRVCTDACYFFFRKLTESAHEKKIRHCLTELRISPSIGHNGHGTAPHVFKEGAEWIKHHLIGR